jgi:hypothetical protein
VHLNTPHPTYFERRPHRGHADRGSVACHPFKLLSQLESGSRPPSPKHPMLSSRTLQRATAQPPLPGRRTSAQPRRLALRRAAPDAADVQPARPAPKIEGPSTDPAVIYGRLWKVQMRCPARPGQYTGSARRGSSA